MDFCWCCFGIGIGGGWPLVFVLDLVLRLKLCCVDFGVDSANVVGVSFCFCC